MTASTNYEMRTVANTPLQDAVETGGADSRVGGTQ